MHMQIGTSVNLEHTKVEKDNCLMNDGKNDGVYRDSH